MGNAYNLKLMAFHVLVWLGIVRRVKYVVTVGKYT